MEALTLFTRRVNRLFLALGGLLSVAILLVITYDLVARNVFSAPTLWALDISRFLMLFMFFLTLAPALESGAHVCVDILVHHLEPGPRRVMRIAARILVLVFGAFLMWRICQNTYEAYVENALFPTVVPIRLIHVYWIAPLGVLQFLLTGIVQLGATMRGRPATPENA